MDAVYFYLMILCWAIPFALLIYWIYLLVRAADFTQRRKLGWFFIIFFGLAALAAIGILVFLNSLDCLETCSANHSQVSLFTTLGGFGAVLLYLILAVTTHRRMRK